VLRHDEGGTLVFHSRNKVPPLDDGLEHRVLRGSVLLALEEHLVIEVLYDVLLPYFKTHSVALVEGLLHQLSGVARILFSSFLEELVSKQVVDVKQEMGVFSSVLYHFFGQGPLSPVSQLVLLICDHSTVRLKQEGESSRFELEHSSGLARIEHIHDVETEVPLQPLNIHVSSVKHLHFVRVVKDVQESGSKL